MSHPSTRPTRLQQLRCRLFQRHGWTYVESFDPRTKAITTNINPDAAMTWPEHQAKRIGAELVAEHRITFELRPVEPGCAP